METSKQEELRERTKSFALRIIRLYQRLPHSPEAQVLGKQLLRSQAAAPVRHFNRGKLQIGGSSEIAGGIHLEIAIVLEEADETVFWLECLIESGIVKPELLRDLLSEANELVAIFAAYRTSRR